MAPLFRAALLLHRLTVQCACSRWTSPTGAGGPSGTRATGTTCGASCAARAASSAPLLPGSSAGGAGIRDSDSVVGGHWGMDDASRCECICNYIEGVKHTRV